MWYNQGMKNTLKLIAAIVLSELAGLLGALFTNPAIPTWYAGLTKSDIVPPSAVFAPVWTILFLLMGIAAFLVWKHGFEYRRVRVALGLFVLQLILNVLWSVIFFNFHSLGGALIEIIILWIAILITILAFGRVSRRAAWLMVPYILWVSFASYLTYSLWVLN